MGERRWIQRGGSAGAIGDIAVWAVPFGLVGARLYHVITDPELHFGAGKDPLTALYIWQGGLGIWGAVAVGALSGYIACRHRGIPFLELADAVAPCIAIAQGIGRWATTSIKSCTVNQARCLGPSRSILRTVAWVAALCHLSADSPLRVDLGPGGRPIGDLGRSALPTRVRASFRPLRDGEHIGTRLDRTPTDRHCQPRPGPSAQCLDCHNRVPRGGRVLSAVRSTTPGPGGHPMGGRRLAPASQNVNLSEWGAHLDPATGTGRYIECFATRIRMAR